MKHNLMVLSMEGCRPTVSRKGKITLQDSKNKVQRHSAVRPTSIGTEQQVCAELIPRKSTFLSVRSRIGVGTRAEYYPWPGGENRR